MQYFIKVKFWRLLAVIGHYRAWIDYKIRKHYSTHFGCYCILSTNHRESIYFAINTQLIYQAIVKCKWPVKNFQTALKMLEIQIIIAIFGFSMKNTFKWVQIQLVILEIALEFWANIFRGVRQASLLPINLGNSHFLQFSVQSSNDK